MKLVKHKVFEGKYKKGDLSMPAATGWEKENDPEYFRQICEYMYGAYCSGNFAVGCHDGVTGYLTHHRRYISEIRTYAHGTIDTTKYQQELDPEDPNTGETLWNIDWTPINLYDKVRNVVRTLLSGHLFTPQATAISEEAFRQKELAKYMLEFEVIPQTQDIMADIGQKAPSDIAPEDIEIMDQLGMLQLDVEAGLKDAIEESLLLSGKQTLEDMWVCDIIDAGFAVGEVIYDDNERKVKTDYIDIENAFFSASEYPDYRDLYIAGYFKQKALADIIPALNRSVTSEEYNDIRQCYSGYAGNSFGLRNNSLNSVANTVDPVGLTVLEMTIYFKDVSAKSFIRGLNRATNYFELREVASDFQITERMKSEGKELKVFEEPTVFKAKWIVGTNIVYDFGKDKGIVKTGASGQKQVSLPIVVAGKHNAAITVKAMPIIDQLNILAYKLRNTYSQMPVIPTIDLDMSVLNENLTLAGKKIHMLDLLKIRRTKGTGIFSSKNEFGDQIGGASNKSPIQYADQSYMKEIVELKQLFLGEVEMLRQETGISEIVEGTSQQKDMLVGIAEMLRGASNNILAPDFNLFLNFYGKIAEIIAKKYQIATITGDITGYVFKENTVKAYKLSKTLLNEELGVKINVLPGEKEQNLILQKLVEMSSTGQIYPEHFLVLSKMIRSGDIARAQLYLTKAMNQVREETHLRNIQVQQAQGEANGKASQMMEQAKQQTLAMQHKFDLELEQMKGQYLIEVARIQAGAKETVADKQLDSSVYTAAINSGNKQSQNL